MANKRVHRLSAGHDRSIWNTGPLARIPNRYVRRPLKGLPIAWEVPRMLWRAQRDSIRDIRLPDFVGIGAPRAGTTWLHLNLGAHPGLCMPDNRKEQRFWNHNLSRGINQYAGAFTCHPSQIAGEISPTYSTMALWRIHLMARMMPDVRILYLIRNPIHRTWSHLSFWANNQGLDVTKLSQNTIRTALTSEEYARASAYTSVYARWCEVFSCEQILVVFYDDIEGDPQRLLRNVFRHLDVSTDVPLEDFPVRSRVNSGLRDNTLKATTAITLPDQWRHLLADHFSEELKNSARVFGGHAKRWAEEALISGTAG